MRWLVVPDMQVPDEDRKAVESVTRFIEDYQPDGLLCVGDELDSPEPSRWSKGYAGEFSGTLQRSIDRCHDVLAGFATALGPDKPFHLMRSNHGDRIRTYIDRYAPALGSLRALDYATLLGLGDLGITYHSKPFEFAPGWMLAHGDEGSLIQTSGGTALGLAKKWGRSVVCGHCFDDQTQILTPQGWVSHESLTDGSVVLTMNKDTGKGEWQQVEAVYRYTNFDELVHINADYGLSLAVTDGHGLVLHSKGVQSFRYPSAAEVYGKAAEFPLALVHDEEALPLRDCEIRFLAWVMAEGNVNDRGYIRIAQSDSNGAIEHLEAVFRECGFSYGKSLRYKGGTVGHNVWRNHDAYRFGMHGVEPRELVAKYLDGKSKNPLRNLAGMSSRQASVFLLEYALADGHRATENAFQLNTKDGAKADFFQELAVRSGRRSSVTRRANDGHFTVSINERSSVRVQPDGWSRQEYSGVVWCVTVPNGTLVVRRGGKTAITQNTHKAAIQHHHLTVNGKATSLLFGMEVGHLMDVRKADYLKAGSSNWQAAIGLIEVDGRTVHPTLIPLFGSRVRWNGVTY